MNKKFLVLGLALMSVSAASCAFQDDLEGGAIFQQAPDLQEAQVWYEQTLMSLNAFEHGGGAIKFTGVGGQEYTIVRHTRCAAGSLEGSTTKSCTP